MKLVIELFKLRRKSSYFVLFYESFYTFSLKYTI